MTLKYCQSHKCHTYDTKDRKRGSKDNRTNQTRRRSSFYYGGGNFCSMNCYNDWANTFMDRAIDQVSGRIVEPMILTEENAWRKVYNHEYWHDNTLPRYIEQNMISGEKRNCEQQVSSVLDEQPQIVNQPYNLGLNFFIFFGWARPQVPSNGVGPPGIMYQGHVKKIIFIFFLNKNLTWDILGP